MIATFEQCVDQLFHVFARCSGTFVPFAMPPWCHCVCAATGALCSAADRHSPVSKGSRAKWPEEPWGRTSRALIFLASCPPPLGAEHLACALPRPLQPFQSRTFPR